MSALQEPSWVGVYRDDPQSFNARPDGYVFKSGEWVGWERYLGAGESGFVVHHHVECNVVVVCSFEATLDGDDPDTDCPILFQACELKTREEWTRYAPDPRID